MKEKLIHIFKEFLDLIFPQKCLGCGRKNVPLCHNCLESIPLLPLTQQRVLAATSYQDEIIKKAVWLFKYRGVKTLAEPLADLLFRLLADTDFYSKMKRTPSSFVIIPIPLSRKKIRKRGYNQSELLGNFLSDKLSVRICPNVLYKIKETPSQVEIKDREKRLKNVQGSFAVKNPELIKDKTIILVDDITTTGATLKEATWVLKQAGAKKVIGVVVAKG